MWVTYRIKKLRCGFL
jgi:hypothetical protein